MGTQESVCKEELEAIKKRVDSWPDYKKANYNALYGDVPSMVFAIKIEHNY